MGRVKCTLTKQDTKFLIFHSCKMVTKVERQLNKDRLP